MRRDYFTLEAAGVQTDDSGRPTVRITYEGPTEELESRLRRGGTPLDGDGVDITYRLQNALDADNPKGVFAIADRVTGEYVLELNADAETVFSVIETVADGDEKNGHYRLVIETDDGSELAVYEKSTLLVYDHGGDLLRERSLIPSGVEI
ncbi:DUF5793 family protein [Natronomonas aquatica]|jgi:hypothetical protein|uniref:DUF5793 family protein n=1 Tax=Natronomonas aquatica TaxID=2841590 RepID=UPI00210BC6F8|nr:DUF5793 family protein [Natronomonas aquatica]